MGLAGVRVFSSEVDPGSRKENASKQEAGASVPIQSGRKGSKVAWRKKPARAVRGYPVRKLLFAYRQNDGSRTAAAVGGILYTLTPWNGPMTASC
jgi:hypothetical protein